MHPRAKEFAELASQRYDFTVDVHEFPEGTKTAADAAEAIGCQVGQIASSITLETPDGIVVCITSGANRVDMDKVAALAGADRATMADAGDIKATLGWSIGGVPPFCHQSSVPVWIDETLLGHDEVWAAAGTPEAVFPITPETLVELSGATVADVREE